MCAVMRASVVGVVASSGKNTMLKLISALVVAASAVALAGCETGSAKGGDPGARPLPAGATCQTIRADLNKMDSQGAQSTVEASTQGKKMTPAQQGVVDRYNGLLNQYLGARCHT
jgi:hypothetical protein